MQDLIRLDDVTVRFDSLIALDRVNLEVRSGEIVGLIGPNGAGKSTALRVAIGEITPTSGRATIAGLAPAEAKSKFGVAPDKDNHIEEFTARRNLEFFASLHDVPNSRVQDLLRLVELESAADRRVAEFSLGMRRRLLLARAFLHRPKVLLLDEPMANLDDPGTAIVTSLLQQARADGAAVLLTSHRLPGLEFTDRICIVERGQILGNCPTEGSIKK